MPHEQRAVKGAGARGASYEAYLRSPEWAKRRAARLAYDGHRCVECRHDGSDQRLEVHHLTYARVGHERIEDLVTLCNGCHAQEHGRAPLAMPVADSLDRRDALARRRDALIRATRRAGLSVEDRVRELAIRAGAGDRAAKRALFVIDKRIERAMRPPISDAGAKAAAPHA